LKEHTSETWDNPEKFRTVDASAVRATAGTWQSQAEIADTKDTEDAPETAKESEVMLDVHPAHHAAGSWKEFSIHFATYVH